VIPVGDEPNEPGTPFVNWLLIVANVAAFAWAWSKAGGDAGYQALVMEWGSVPASLDVRDLFTSMFMHAGLMHLGGNMLYLWIFGDNVEARLGHLGYLAAYLATGLAGGLVDAAMRPGSAIPGIGASGAISGVLGMYLVGFPRNRVKLLVWVWWYAGIALVPAWIVLAIFFLLENFVPAMSGYGTGGGVAYGAHLGGFAAGALLFVLLLPALRRARPTVVERYPGW
jgi:membrane associated rhomboid family serine protease